MDHSYYGSRIVYPQMPEQLTEIDLVGFLTASPEEKHGFDRIITGVCKPHTAATSITFL